MSSTLSGSTTATWSTTTSTRRRHSTRVRRWLTRLRPRIRTSTSSTTSFTKTYPDYILGDDRGPTEYDATWTRATSAPRVITPPNGVADDDYMSFMRNRRGMSGSFRRPTKEPRYLSFNHDIDLDAIDLSAPAKRRLSFRWSDIARSHSMNH